MNSSQRGGANIAAGDFNGDGFADIAVGAGPEGGPRVRIFDSVKLTAPDPNVANTFLDFFAFNSNLRDGVRVALRNIDGDNQADLITGTGDNFPRIKTFIGGISGGPGAPLLVNEFVPFGATQGDFGAWVG